MQDHGISKRENKKTKQKVCFNRLPWIEKVQ